MSPSTPISPLLASWRETLARCAALPAILSPCGEMLRTFEEIDREARACRELFAGIPQGHAVALQLGNVPHWPALILALAELRLAPLPLGLHLGGLELRQALDLCRCAALVTEEEGRLQVLREENSAPVSAEFLKLTSGTTGSARAIGFRMEALLADAGNICLTMGITAQDLNYAAIPVSHSYGFSNLITPLLAFGVPMVLTGERLPRAILAGLEKTGATVFPGMPVFYDKLAALATVPELPRLRVCLSAGAPLPATVAREFTRRYGRKIHTFYGSSECGGIAYDRSDEPHYEDGFLGTAMEGVQLRPLSEGGAPGPLEVRSAAVGLGYLPAGDRETLDGERFVPGDLVRWDDRGFWLAGRVSDLINIAGRKLNPAEVESRMVHFPGVRQAVVFGIPSSLRGEEPVACVAGEELDRAALQRFCLENLSQWQVPRDFWIVPEIPANERGKISRRALAEEYQARRKSA